MNLKSKWSQQVQRSKSICKNAPSNSGLNCIFSSLKVENRARNPDFQPWNLNNLNLYQSAQNLSMIIVISSTTTSIHHIN